MPVGATQGQVWFNDRRVGRLRADDGGQIWFSYTAEWVDHGFPISLKLPLESTTEVHAHAYFAGLLPEGRTRMRIVRELRLPHGDDAALLLAIGRDCAGALSILPDDETPSSASSKPVPLSENDLNNLVQRRGAGAPKPSIRQRFSLAGAQDKVAVICEGDKLWLPNARHPSSHILKFETLPWVCFSEYLGHGLARSVGLETCATRYLVANAAPAMPYLRILRYDRASQGDVHTRLHQEDIAQALGYDSDQKYEHDGGPSLADISLLLRRIVIDPIEDILRLRDWQLFNYLIGNSDAHAKNLSLLYDSDSTLPRLAPFYDLVCVEFFNRIGAATFDRRMALSVGDRWEPEEIRQSDWHTLAQHMQVSAPALLRRLDELSQLLPTAAATLRQRFGKDHGDNQVYDRAVESVRDRCRWVQNNVLATR